MAVSQQWRPFFLILIMQAMYRDDEQGKQEHELARIFLDTF